MGLIYTTNPIEAVNSSFRKVAKNAFFPSEHALRKLFYLRISHLYKKWNDQPLHNWPLVRRQLSLNHAIHLRILKYESDCDELLERDCDEL